MIIAVDFDGTLHCGEFPDIGKPLPGAVDVMRRLKSDGHHIIIWTCREDKHLSDALNWLEGWEIQYDCVNENATNGVGRFGYNARKVYADVYIDDRQVGGLPAWYEIYGIIKESHPSKNPVELCGILEVAAIAFGMSADCLISKSRRLDCVLARHAYCLAARELTGLSSMKIGRVINRHHATVLNSYRAAEALIETRHTSFVEKYNHLKNLLQ